MQKEAFFFKKFCITVRNETEWKELVEQGYNFLAGSDPEKILGIYRQLASKKFSMLHQFYGKGEAGKQIVNLIRNQNPGL